jgi:hypothetical protein
MVKDLMDGLTRAAFMPEPVMPEPVMPEPVMREPARSLKVRLPGMVLRTPPD